MALQDRLLIGSYDYRIVALSALIAVVASYATLDLVARVTEARGRNLVPWLIFGGTALGIGIWATHFVGMVAFHLALPMWYDWPTALSSLCIAIVASATGMLMASRPGLALRRAVAGAVCLGAGIAGLHFTAMASFRAWAMTRYSPIIVALSIASAIAFSLLALWFTFLLRTHPARRKRQTLGGAVLMAAAICTMHYTGMSAATFTRSDVAPDLSHAVGVSTLGISGIGLNTIMILVVAVLTGALNQAIRAEQALEGSLWELRTLAGRIQSALEEERKRLAREVHDELGQALTSIKINLASLIREMAPADATPSERARSTLAHVDETIRVVRRIATDLRPGILDDLGLVAAVEWAVQDFQLRTGVISRASLPDIDLAVDPERATAVFRVLQEALTNVARHAHASEVMVRLARVDRHLDLEVRDNGIGVDLTDLPPARFLGILGMRERASLLGGELTIHSSPGRGTTVILRVPSVKPRAEPSVTQERKQRRAEGRPNPTDDPEADSAKEDSTL